jgi:lipid II:glycine glycyltransferase (peptidoglycan interpeptide bridge formation enzyme)
MAHEATAEADKKRDQTYEDQLRALDVQEKMLELKAKQAKVARANDYIDQDLNRSRAETDEIQSRADAARNISSGEKSFLNQAGQADIARVTGVVSN